MDRIGGQVDIQFKYVKLTFNVIEFECNGLNPTVKSWGTANHVKIWDGKKSKTIDCDRLEQRYIRLGTQRRWLSNSNLPFIYL